ncbi:MAG: DUF2793 domain-containing protein [Pseudomonadota bacterium]
MSFADFTPRLGLPYLLANQAQKHVTVNESLQRLDALCMGSVLAIGSTPPTEPEERDAFLLGDSPDAEWSLGHMDDVACFMDGVWRFLTPRAGWRVWNVEASKLLVFDGAAWGELVPDSKNPAELQDLARIGLGTTATESNPLAIELNAALFNAKPDADGGTNDLRVSYNKPASANTASFLFQTSWSGRAEIGLTGDDRLTLKVSDDGTNWQEGWVLDATTRTAETALNIAPQQSNAQDLGHSAKPFRAIYLGSDPVVLSDARTKSHIEPIEQARHFLSALRPVQFVQEGSTALRFGFVAQEVRAALNEAGYANTALWRLSEPNDADSSQQLAPTQLIAPLVAVVQDLTRRVAALEKDQQRS